MPFVYDSKTHNFVDFDYDAELISIRGFSDGTKVWKIRWGDEEFGFHARDTVTYSGPRNNTPESVEWFVTSMQIPENLANRRIQIMDLIKESLEGRGLGARFTGPVTVNFDPRLIQNV